MKRLKSIVIRFSIIFLGVGLFFLIFFSLVASNVKADLLVHKIPSKDEIIDSIAIHFIHGSIPEENCSYNKNRLGGYLGGHVEIEVDSIVYGFLYDSLPMDYLPKEAFNSKFEKRGHFNWKNYTKNDKITTVFIPITIGQKENLKTLLYNYIKTPPYDYAFFGQRCTSSTAKILSDSKIINEFTNFESVIAFFYPRSFRNTLVSYARINNLKVDLKIGIDCHRWE